MIIRVSQYDILSAPVKKGQIYYVPELRLLYKDFGNSLLERTVYKATVVNTDYERLNRIRPANGVNYYVVENNQLWVYDTKWILKDGDIRQFNAYTYDSNGIEPVISSDEYITSSTTGDRIIDNNGLLGNGTVAVRDKNRIIKGTWKVDDSNSRLELSSLLDNGIIIRPYGVNSDAYTDKLTGSLDLSIESQQEGTDANSAITRSGKATLYGDLYVKGDVYLSSESDNTNLSISYNPKVNEQLIHTFKYVIDNTADQFQYADVKITVYGDGRIIMNIVTYTLDSNSATTDIEGNIIYTGNILRLLKYTYNDIRRGGEGVDGTRIAYTWDHNENNASAIGISYFILTGSAVNANVSIGMCEGYTIPEQNVYANTKLIKNININKVLDKLCEATGVDINGI